MGRKASAKLTNKVVSDGQKDVSNQNLKIHVDSQQNKIEQ